MLNQDRAIAKPQRRPPYRALQYLGAKLRSLHEITAVVSQLAAPRTYVVDMFAGSGVVSRALSDAGFAVVAVDVQAYSATICRALLCIGRNRDNGDLAESLRAASPESPWLTVAESWIEDEAHALRQGDGEALASHSHRVPQAWRPEGATPAMLRLFDGVRQRRGRTCFDLPALIGSYYSGSYFGIQQAGEFDRARAGIENLKQSRSIDDWGADVLTTALIGAMSDAVFSAGKHFAQPFSPNNSNMKFAAARLLSDRGVDVWRSMTSRIKSITRPLSQLGLQHYVLQRSFEEVTIDDLPGPISVIYADPPYTAQQYSRFYHLPETVTNYSVPELSTHNGSVTKGLYPEGRFKSRFSSVTQAPDALSDICLFARRANASLVLSYSATEGNDTGNKRMMTLERVIEVCGQVFGVSAIDSSRLDISYRQFNSLERSRASRTEAEYLIVCRHRC